MEDLLLPPDVQAELDALRDGEPESVSAEKLKTLDQIGQALASKRDEAVKSRRNSGLEEVWTNCEEAYIGIDDANRGEFVNAKWAKPMTSDGPVTTNDTKAKRDEEVRSTAYVRLTARYVDAGAAKIGEILLPPDDKAFSIEPTPDPDLIAAKDDRRQLQTKAGVLLQRDATPDEQAQMQAASPPPASPTMGTPAAPTAVAGTDPPSAPGTASPQPPQVPGVPLIVKDLAKEQLEKAEDAAEKAERRIWDWMIEGKYTREMRKVIHDAARIGVGILKAPFPMKKRAMALTKTVDPATGKPVIGITMQDKIIPGMKHISPWDFFPHGACGENVHYGDYVFERDFVSERQLREFKGLPGYLDSQIDKVILEGPSKKYVTAERPNQSDTEERYELWYFYGVLSGEDMRAINPKMVEETEDGAPPKPVYAVCTMVNDSVIKGDLNPLDSGEFPYDAMPWQRRSGSWAGIGVGEQIAMPQKMATAGVRAMLNNAGKSGGAQIVVNRKLIVPADGKWTLTGQEKIWFPGPDSEATDDVKKAFAVFEFPNHTDQFLKIIELAFKLAEEACNIPLISQGQSGDTTPDTFGAAQLQDNNANQLLRSIGYGFDDSITEPVVQRMYEWLLLDPDVPDEEKGDFQINAHGSSALVERHLQEQTLAQMAPMVDNPKYKIDPEKYFEELMRSKRLVARKMQYTDEQKEKIDQQPPPKAPVVQAAEIRAQVDLQRSKMDTDRDTAYVQAEHAKVEADHDLRSRELEMKTQLAMLDYANKRGIALEAVKSELASVAMKLRVQKELSAIDTVTDLHKHHSPAPVLTPPTEPEGTAKPGRAFES